MEALRIYYDRRWSSTFKHGFIHYKVYLLVISSYLQVRWKANENEKNNKNPIKNTRK